MKRSYAVIGVGAVGGLYGSRLQKAGHEVHFLLRSDYEHVCQNGLIVQSVKGDIVLPSVNAYNDPDSMPACDVVMIALKATENHVLKDIVPKVLKEEGTILLLQNGLGAEEELSEMFPNTCIIGGLCFLCCNKIGPGLIHHVDYGHMHLGEFKKDGSPAGVTDRVSMIVEDLLDSGTDAKPLEDLLLARWRKLVWNVPFNGLTVLLGTTTDRLVAVKETAELSEALMYEVVSGAAVYDREIHSDFVELMMEYTRKMVPYKPSMLLDFEAGRPMELEAIYGNPIRAAERRGCLMPATEFLYKSLCFIERERFNT